MTGDHDPSSASVSNHVACCIIGTIFVMERKQDAAAVARYREELIAAIYTRDDSDGVRRALASREDLDADQSDLNFVREPMEPLPWQDPLVTRVL